MSGDGQWDCGVTLKAIRHGEVTWTVAVPAINPSNRDAVSAALDASVDEALRIHGRLDDEFTRRTRNRGDR